MKKLLMSATLAVSSLLVITACANTSAATDTKPYNTMQNQNRSVGPGANSPLAQLDLTASQQAQIQEIMQNNRGERMQNHDAIQKILTPEQRQKMTQLKEDRMASGQQGSRGKHSQGMRRNQ